MVNPNLHPFGGLRAVLHVPPISLIAPIRLCMCAWSSMGSWELIANRIQTIYTIVINPSIIHAHEYYINTH